MFVHHPGRFSQDYREPVTRRWQALAAGEPILFDKNDFDDALDFVTSNLRGFIAALHKTLALADQRPAS